MEEQLELLKDAEPLELRQFAGAAVCDDEYRGAMEAVNVVFGERTVQTRPGFTPLFTPGPVLAPTPRRIQGIAPWDAQSSANRLLYMWKDPTAGFAGKVVSRTLSNGDEWDLQNLGGDAESFTAAFYGGRTFFAGGQVVPFAGAAAGGFVWNGDIVSGFPAVDKLFQRPFLTSEITLAMTPTALAPGEFPITAGEHIVACIVTTRNGHPSGVSPIEAGTRLVVGFSFTATGADAYQLSATPATVWPAWVYSIQAVMTPITNLEKLFYVPVGNTINTVAPGGAGAALVRVAISDYLLAQASTAREVEDLSQQLQLGTGGEPPILPYIIAEGPDGRMTYVCQIADELLNQQSAVVISDPNKPQRASFDRNMIQLPGFRKITAICWNGTTLYMFGPHRTYSRSATGASPIEWPTEETLDGKIGSPFPKGVGGDPARGYLLVGDQSGLYKFAGNAYDRIPLSRFQGAQDWARIHWGAESWCFEIDEDPTRRMIFVKAALLTVGLAAPSYPTHIMCFDYSNGMDPYKIQYSRMEIGAPNGVGLNGPDLSPGAIAVGLDSNSMRKSLWVARGDAAGVVNRWMDLDLDSTNANLYCDGVNTDTSRIPYLSAYTTERFAGLRGLSQWIAAKLSLRGGPVGARIFLYAVMWISVDGSTRGISADLRALLLRAADAITDCWILRKFPQKGATAVRKAPTMSVRVSNGRVAGAWWKITRSITTWHLPWARGRR